MTIVEHALTSFAFDSMLMKYWNETLRAPVYLNKRLPTFVLHHKTCNDPLPPNVYIVHS